MEVSLLSVQLERLKVPELKELLRNRNLQLSGVKHVLVHRLLTWAQRNNTVDELYQIASEYAGVRTSRRDQLRDWNSSVYEPLGDLDDWNGPSQGHWPEPYMQPASAPSANYVAGVPSNVQASSSNQGQATAVERGKQALENLATTDIFHEWVAPVYPCVMLCPGYDGLIQLDLSEVDAVHSIRDSCFKILVYCLNLQSGTLPPKMEWPQAISIQVNARTAEVRQQCSDGRNRNKSVLERPCDIKALVSLEFVNRVRFTIPISDQFLGSKARTIQFAAGIFLMRERTTSDLLSKMQRRSREESVGTIKKVFGDGEVIFDKMLVKLRDPISLKRISLPAKGVACQHVQCFDARGFFDYQRTARNAKFRCFLCNSPILTASDVVADEWFEQVLKSTESNPDIDEVEYFEDGTWKPVKEDGTRTPGEEPRSPNPIETGQVSLSFSAGAGFSFPAVPPSVGASIDQGSALSPPEGLLRTSSTSSVGNNGTLLRTCSTNSSSLGPRPCVPSAPIETIDLLSDDD